MLTGKSPRAEYSTQLRSPKFVTSAAGEGREETAESKERGRALMRASVDMLFSTDVSRLDDAGVRGLYESVTEGVWGIPDKEGAFFGKRGSKDDPRRNVELLRQFFKGNYKLAEDDEAREFRAKSWEEKFRYALEHESRGNMMASSIGGERGLSFGERIYLAFMSMARQDSLLRDEEKQDEAEKDMVRRLDYEKMTPEEKLKYETDVITDYDRKLSRREPLVSYLRMAAGISDEGAYILAKSYREDALDVPAILGLPEEEQGKVMTAYAQMKGDLGEGRILGVKTDFSTGTAGDRFQMGLYGLQQSVVSLGTDLYSFAESAAMRAYAQIALDSSERASFYRAWDALERAKISERKPLPESESIGGEMYQSFMENCHWIIPYGGAAKALGKAKGAAGAISKIDRLAELKGAAKTAALKDALKVSLFSRLSPMRDGMKYADATLERLLVSVDKYTRELQELKRMKTAYGLAKGGYESAWLVARSSAFSAFAQEYLEAADAAGISREESVLTAVWVGLINDRIEQMYVPGLESRLTKGELKSIGLEAFRRSIAEGRLSEFTWNFMKRYFAEGARVTATEGWVEEPLQQLVIEHGKAVDKLAAEMKIDGVSIGRRAAAEVKELLTFDSRDVKTYLDTAIEMMPASMGFGITTVPGQLVRRRLRNRMAARRTGIEHYDEGIVGIYQRELDVRNLIEQAWSPKGAADGETDENAKLGRSNKVDDAMTKAREIHETDDGTGDLPAKVASEIGVDVKTAEAIVQLLDEEAEVARFDPRARSMIDQFFSGVRINEETIASLLPGYVPDSFEADEENGVYVAKVNVGKEDGIKGGVKTIVYRRRDGVFFNPDGTLNEEEIARASSPDSELGVSYDRRIAAGGGEGRLWRQLSDAERRREALVIVNGRTDEGGSVSFRKEDGTEVTVKADAIVNLATGRLADIGYGMAAKQSTVRHETFHALWMFAKELVSDEEKAVLAKALSIDVKKEGWESELDEAMAHQMEEYASGHYISNAMSTRFERFQAWAAGAFAAMDANAVLDASAKSRENPLTRTLGEGQPFALRSFYDAVIAGRIGSGELGIEKIVVPAAPKAADASVAGDELPVEPAKEADNKEDKEDKETADASDGGEKPAGADGMVHRPEWDKGDRVVKRVPKKKYRIHCKLEVVNVFDGIRTSWSEGFDSANQGRQTDTEESEALVDSIAADPDYSKGGTVMEFTGSGAPLVAPSGDVLDGNHHMRGIQLAYERGSEKAAVFRERVLAEAKERGLAVDEHAAEAPVIICRVESVEVDEGEQVPSIAQIAEDTNDTVQRGLNVYETAAKDARIMIANNLIPKFAIDADTGLVKDEEEKRNGGNLVNPIGIFRQKSGAQGILSEDKKLTEYGQERLMNGILAALLGGTNPKVVQAIMEKSKHLDMENEMRALMRLAPELMALVNDPAKRQYDIREDLLEALTWYQEWRNQDEAARAKAGKTKTEWRKAEMRPTAWVNYKGDMFSKPSDAAEILGDLFAAAQSQRSFQSDGETDTKAGRKRAQELIVDELRDYLANVYATNTETNDIFGDFKPPTRAEILATQRKNNSRYSVDGLNIMRPYSLMTAEEFDAIAREGKTTETARDIGFILPDGRMIPYSSHIAIVMPVMQMRGLRLSDTTGYRMVGTALKSGAVRVGGFSNAWLQVGAPFSPAQEDRVREYFEEQVKIKGGGSFVLDLMGEDGKIESATYSLRASPERIFSDVREFYENGTVPRGQSMLSMMFHFSTGAPFSSSGESELVTTPYRRKVDAAEFDTMLSESGSSDTAYGAGFFLPDGRLVREYTHGANVMPILVMRGMRPFPENAARMVGTVIRSGAVCSGGSERCRLDVGAAFTEAQAARVREYLDDWRSQYRRGMTLTLGLMRPDGDFEEAVYSLKVDPGRVVDDVRRYYEDGVVPRGDSMLSIISRFSVALKGSKPLMNAGDIADFSYSHIFNGRHFDRYHALDRQITVWAIPMTAQRRPVTLPVPVFKGLQGALTMHPREMFSDSLKWSAKRVAFIRTEPISGSRYDMDFVGKRVEAGMDEKFDYEWMKKCGEILGVSVDSWTVMRSDGRYRDISEPPFEDRAPSRGEFLPPLGRSKFARLFYPDAGVEIKTSVVWKDYAFGNYSVGARRKAEYRDLLKRHRPDMAAEDVEAMLESIDGYDNPKKEKLAIHWTITGAIRIPEDEYKLDKAIATAERARVDPFGYRNPEDIMLAFPQHVPKEKPIDPDKVPELSDRRDLGHGIVTYLVSEKLVPSEGEPDVMRPEGQIAMRKIINSHWGADTSPWCLLQGDDNGVLTRGALDYWKYYSKLPKRVAFRNGKLLAFMATDKANVDYNVGVTLFNKYRAEFDEYCYDFCYENDDANFMSWLSTFHKEELDLAKVAEEWWDRMDMSHAGIPFVGKVDGDALGRSSTIEVDRYGNAKQVGKLWKGRRSDGVYEEWLSPGVLLLHEERRNGKLHGKCYKKWENGNISVICEYREDNPVGRYRAFDRMGRVYEDKLYDQEGRPIAPSKLYYESKLSSWTDHYADGSCKTVFKFTPNGGVRAARFFQESGDGDGTYYAYDGVEASKVEFATPDGLWVTANFLDNEYLDSLAVKRADGSGVKLGLLPDGRVHSYRVLDAAGYEISGGSWTSAGVQTEMIYKGHSLRYKPDGSKWDLRMPVRGSEHVASWNDRPHFTDEFLKTIPNEKQPSSLEELSNKVPSLRGVEKSIRDFVNRVKTTGEKILAEDAEARKREAYPSFSVRLRGAKRDAILRRKPAVTQMELELFAERKQVKGKRVQKALDDAKVYQDFIDAYRPLFTAAMRDGDWLPALDFSEERGMPCAANVLKQYFRDPQFDMQSLSGLRIRSVDDMAAILMTVRSPFVESTKAIYLDIRRRILEARILTIGGNNSAEILRGTILRHMPKKTAYVVFAHNHPSGHPNPSKADVATTMELKKELKTANVKLLDHIITDGDSYYSFNYQAIRNIDVERPKWEVLPASETMSECLTSPRDMLDYVANHLRDDGSNGHVIFLNGRLAVVGVRRIPAAPRNPEEFASWAQRVAEGSESVGASQVMVDLGPEEYTFDLIKDLLGVLGPNFGYHGISLTDALYGSSGRGRVESTRMYFFDKWSTIAPEAEEVNNEDRFNYPRYSIASRGFAWSDLKSPAMEKVITSTTVTHLTGQDRFPERYLTFKWYRDRGMLPLIKKQVEEWAATPESSWFGKYLLAKYYGNAEFALEVAAHHLNKPKIDELAQSLDMSRPIIWVYVKNNDGRRTNRLPQAYAMLLKASKLGGTVDSEIQKVSDERNTGATLKSRAGRDFQFSGKVRTRGRPQYVIVDDVWTTGQTAVSLMEYIMSKGGEVSAITTLAVASNGTRIIPTGSQLQSVLEKAKIPDVERALELTGVDLRKATGSELQAYIVKGSKGAAGLQSWFGDVSPTLPLDFTPEAERRRDVGNTDAASGFATRYDLFAHLNSEQRKHLSTKPRQGAFRFSTLFPRLAELDDDTLVAAALASRLALDRKDRMQLSLKYDTVASMLRGVHPNADDEEIRRRTLAVQGETLKLARKIRQGLDSGVSESAILKSLNDSLKPRFETEMRREGREGAKVGAFGANAESMLKARGERIFGEAVRVQAGVDTDLFEAWAGVDLVNTLWKVLENAKAEWRPRKKAELSEEGAGGEETESERGEKDPSEYKTEELENPRRFAEYVRDLAAKYWREKRGLPVGSNPWSNQIAVQFLRKTAANIYTKLVNAITYSRSRDTAFRAIQKFDSIPTVQGVVSQMTYVGEIIHARHIRETKQSLCETLEKLLKTKFGATGRFKPDREELRRKVGAEMELRARYMRHAMWLTPEAASDEAGELSRTLTSMMTEYEEAGRDIEQSRVFVDTMRKLHILREFGALKYKTVGEIETALRYWEEIAEGAADKIVEAFETREARTKAAAAVLARAFTNPKKSHAVERGASLAINNYLTAHMGFASILEDMMRFSSGKDREEAARVIEYLTREIQKAGDRSAAEARRHGEAFIAAVEAIYGKSFKKAAAELNREDPAFEQFMGAKGGKRIVPTRARAMQLLVSLLQGSKPGSHYFENVKKHGREGQAAAIANLMTPQDLNLIKWIGQWYEENRKELSDVCEALFGIGVYSEASNYFPVKMLLPKQGLEKVEGVAWTIFPKALTPRVKNLRDFDTEADILSMWTSRMEEAVQWKGHAKLGLELRGIFGRSELQESVIANHGGRVNSLMLGFITDILAGHGAYDRTTGGIEYFSDKIRGWTALCALGGNIGVMFKQTTSFPAFGFEIGLVNTARYTLSAFTPAGLEAMGRLFESEQRKTRWKVGNTEAVKNALSRGDAGWFKRMLQASMITNKIGDIVPGLVVGQGIYRDCLARGMSEENAMAQTWMLIERTQQSGRMENQTSVQRRNRLGRMLYQFLSTQQQYLQYELRSIRGVVADPSLPNVQKLARTILLNHFILSSLYYWMGELYKAMLGSEPPEEQLTDWVVTCLLGPYASLYVLGFSCKVSLERFLKGSWSAAGKDMLPMESFIKSTIGDAVKVVEVALDNESSTDDLVDSLADLFSHLNPIVRDVRKVKQNLEE